MEKVENKAKEKREEKLAKNIDTYGRFVFILTFIPFIFITYISIMDGVNGYTMYAGYSKYKETEVLYGLDAFLLMFPMRLYYYTFIKPVFLGCLVYQVSYFITKLKLKKIQKKMKKN